MRQEDKEPGGKVGKRQARQAALGPGSLTLCGLYKGNYVHFHFEALIFGWMLFN